MMNANVKIIRSSSEPLYVVVPWLHPLAERKSVYLKDLEGEPLILALGGDRVSPIELKLRELCAKKKLVTNIVQRTPELSMTINLVSTGFGISLVPRSLRAIRREEVVYLPFISAPQVRAETAFLTRRGDISPAVANLSATVFKINHKGTAS